ncbi:MAG: hypothetical protein WC046_10195, partial [Candidatus Bathyarchaeia archaeon]
RSGCLRGFFFGIADYLVCAGMRKSVFVLVLYVGWGETRMRNNVTNPSCLAIITVKTSTYLYFPRRQTP